MPGSCLRVAGLLAALALSGAGCGAVDGSAPPASAAATAPAAPTDAPATEVTPPTDGAAPPAAGFLPGEAVRVAAAKVTFFEEASEASTVMGEAAHDEVLIISGAPEVDAAGALWLYAYVAHSPVPGRLPDLPQQLPYPEFVLTGWIRAGDAQSPRIAALPPRCPPVPDLAMAGAMLGSEHLACFGNRQLTFDGISGCGPCGGGDMCEPAWLACNSGGSIYDPNGETSRLALYLPPPFVAPEQGKPIRVSGHFDDPRAATCTWANEADPTPVAIVVELCRRHFVVDAILVQPTQPPNPLE
jgi:hypothetical protein